MHAPQPPRPAAKDLEPHERALAARFAGLRRLAPPAGLEAGCLADAGTLRLPVRTVGARFATPLSWAAGVLLAVGVVTMATSSPRECGHGGDGATRAGTRLTVVDDPSVSLFHGVESFDRLSPAPMLAWNGAGKR